MTWISLLMEIASAIPGLIALGKDIVTFLETQKKAATLSMAVQDLRTVYQKSDPTVTNLIHPNND